ncbi:hypothetical protein [Spirosoma validum]|uniref:Uncharacterized protein n=1 Tax=Spirosoma validum TaxID=2771355 RepID=A0A927AYB3_9BACT|nr:hypothetical protein [Spirosoma validum]MBD2752075.1 hypothetical protein [Spirosoma validum]
MRQFTNPRFLGMITIIAGIVILAAIVYKHTHNEPTDWGMYVISASSLLTGIGLLRIKSPIE